jgi:hypothetical protein
MAEQATFGRRALSARVSARDPYDVDHLSPEAEAFLATLNDRPPEARADFANWRRAQRPRRLLVVLVGAAFMAPGLFCFLFQAPWWLSIGLSLAGVGVNGWLRRERQSQAKAIAGWTPSGG